MGQTSEAGAHCWRVLKDNPASSRTFTQPIYHYRSRTRGLPTWPLPHPPLPPSLFPGVWGGTITGVGKQRVLSCLYGNHTSYGPCNVSNPAVWVLDLVLRPVGWRWTDMEYTWVVHARAYSCRM